MDSREAARPAWAEIDTEALERNYLNVARLAGPGVKVMAAIKGDAYGHGVVEVARALSAMGVFALMTGDFDEAVAIRAAGVGTKIVMFGGHLPDGAGELLGHGLIPTVYNIEAAQAVSRAATGAAPVYVKIDSGLGRLGVALDDALAFIKRVAALPNLVVEGAYTHLPFGDESGRAWAERGIAAFDGLVGRLAREGPDVAVTQARASAAVVAGIKDRCNAVCVGHVLYGLCPTAPGVVDMAGFEPVLRSVKTRLIHVARHPAGRDIAVGGLYGIRNSRVTGVIPMGLTNGLRNAPKGQAIEMLLRGRRVPVMSVSLEHTTLDLSEIDEPRVGEDVVALGEQAGARITLDEIAGRLGRSPLEVTMTFSKRLPLRAGSFADEFWARFQDKDTRRSTA